MRVIFAGTPDFAEPSLRAIAQSRHSVALVVTQPDRPAGRGRAPAPPPVKLAAQQLGLPVLQTGDINAPDVVAALRQARPDALCVVAFGQKLRRAVLTLPSQGCLNAHASLLPLLRGAAPIVWSILLGHTQTGVTTQRVVPRFDEGDVLLQRATPIGPDETAGQLHDRLALMAADLWPPTLDGIEDGSITPAPQDHSLATYAPTLTKEQGRIDWRQTSADIRNFVRAMTPWPSAQTSATLASGQTLSLTILAVQPLAGAAAADPGRVLAASAEGVVVATGSGAIRVLRLQRAGKRPLDASEFLRGCPLAAGDLFHAPA